MEIYLARHGKPDLRPWARVNPQQMQQWIQAYDASGLVPQEFPSQTTEAARRAAVVVSSTSRRAVESVYSLIQEPPHVTDALFCEAGLPHTMAAFPRLPPQLWAAAFRLAWFAGYCGKAESLREAKARAQAAASRLAGFAENDGSVLLVGHGIMNHLIAQQLSEMGWQGARRTRSGYGQVTRYVRSKA